MQHPTHESFATAKDTHLYMERSQAPVEGTLHL